MTFQTCDPDVPQNVYSLKDHEASAIMVFLAEPQLHRSKFRGSDRVQFVFPVYVEGKVTGWPVGSNLYRRLRDNWTAYYCQAVQVTRDGKRGDPNTDYVFKPLPPGEKLQVILGTDHSAAIQEVFGLLSNNQHPLAENGDTAF